MRINAGKAAVLMQTWKVVTELGVQGGQKLTGPAFPGKQGKLVQKRAFERVFILTFS